MAWNGNKSDKKQKEHPWASVVSSFTSVSAKIIGAPVTFINKIGNAAKSTFSKVPEPQQSHTHAVNKAVSTTGGIQPPTTGFSDLPLGSSFRIPEGSSSNDRSRSERIESFRNEPYSKSNTQQRPPSQAEQSFLERKKDDVKWWK